jgi:hypothetical protein
MKCLQIEILLLGFKQKMCKKLIFQIENIFLIRCYLSQQNARQKKTVCRFWLSNNKCTKGDECSFLHQQPVIEDDDEDENEDEEVGFFDIKKLKLNFQ